jgi:chemotaxis protein methyltransferase CheR
MATSPATDYGFLRELVLRETQNVLDPSCDYLFETRLSGLLRALGMSRLDQLVRRLRSANDPELERAVAQAMTIGETSFFRDSRLFELLRTALLPALIEARRPCRTLRLWSAACSTGQEAYSAAILLREQSLLDATWVLRIEGTDIASDAIERASRGIFHRIEMNRGLAPRHIARYFDRAGENWVARPEIRRMCNFRQANICRAPLPFHQPFDVILLRNAMLYFSQETRRSLLAGVHGLLAPDGFLLLGSAEQPPDAARWCAVLDRGACYYRPR